MKVLTGEAIQEIINRFIHVHDIGEFELLINSLEDYETKHNLELADVLKPLK